MPAFLNFSSCMYINKHTMAIRFVLFSVFTFFCGVHGIQEFCSINTYNNSDNNMQFSKEATFEEFAVAGKFKALHCCAKGYRSIEWYKDDKLYPWALQLSRLILFPDSANQTIYTQSVTEGDAGNYTCVLRNDTVLHAHTIHLKVFEKVPDDPKITYISQDTEVAVGQSLRLFCEAFGGQVDLPDAHSDAYWQKVSPNGTIYDVPSHVQQLKNNREDGQTFGVYMMIPDIRRDDFSDYVCIISKPGNTIERIVSVREKVDTVEYINPNPIPVGKLILVSSAVLFLFLALVVLYLQFGLKIQVRLKDHFGNLEENDSRTFDVLVVHSIQDSELALGVLSPALESYKYKLFTRTLSESVNLWYTTLKEDSQKCRRIIAVLSPALFNGTWDSNTILPAIKQLQSLCPKLICITLKELPKIQNEVKNSQGETLGSIAHSVGILEWTRKSEDKFWYSLRLRLPPKRNRNSKSQTEARLKVDSQGCSDNVV